MLVFLVVAAATVQPADLFTRAVSAARHNYNAQLVDQFAGSTAPEIIGRPFTVSYPLRSGDATGSNVSGFYSYKDGVLTLDLSPNAIVRKREGGFLMGYSGIVVRAVRVRQPGYVGSNGYGARAAVVVARLDQDGLLFRQPSYGDPGIREAPEGEVPDLIANDPYLSREVSRKGQPTKRTKYTVKMTLAPEKARAVALDTGVVVEGVFALVDGVSTLCDGTYSGATVGKPTELYGTNCYAGAKINRIAFVRRTSGEVLKEWTTAP